MQVVVNSKSGHFNFVFRKSICLALQYIVLSLMIEIQNTNSPMKKYIISFICVMNLLVFPFIINADTSMVIKVGTYENYPKIFTGEDDTVAGLWADILQYICAKENWQLEWVSGTWAQGLKKLKTGEINIMPDTGWTEPRSRQYDFSRETVLVSWSRLYVPQDSEINSIIADIPLELERVL